MKTPAYLLLASLLVGFKTDSSLPDPSYESKIKFSYANLNEPKDEITVAIKKAKEVLNDPAFYKGIASKTNKPGVPEGRFSHTRATPEEIAVELQKAELTIRVRQYAGGEDTKTLAYVTSDLPTTIFINSSKTDRGVLKIANTIIHELIHILDRATPEARFGHGGNSASGKKKSAPYWIGSYAMKRLSGDALVDQLVVNEDDLIQVEETETLDEDFIDKDPVKLLTETEAALFNSSVKTNTKRK